MAEATAAHWLIRIDSSLAMDFRQGRMLGNAFQKKLTRPGGDGRNWLALACEQKRVEGSPSGDEIKLDPEIASVCRQ